MEKQCNNAQCTSHIYSINNISKFVNIHSTYQLLWTRVLNDILNLSVWSPKISFLLFSSQKVKAGGSVDSPPTSALLHYVWFSWFWSHMKMSKNVLNSRLLQLSHENKTKIVQIVHSVSWNIIRYSSHGDRWRGGWPQSLGWNGVGWGSRICFN